jgi:hypothetical protein
MDFDNSSRLKDIAVDAANAFLNRGTALNEKIAELAEAENLTSEQATRVCEFANHAVWSTLRKTASTVEFPIAEPEKVRQSLGHGPKFAMVGKVASMTGDNKNDGLTPKTASIGELAVHAAGSLASNMATSAAKKSGLSPARSLKVADEFDELEAKQNAVIAYDRAKVAAAEARDLLQASARTFVDGLERFTAWAKEAAIDGEDLDAFLCKVAQDRVTAAKPEMLWKVAYCIKAAGIWADKPVTLSDATMAALEPTALSKVAQDVEQENFTPGLHMSGMPVQIINGRHQGVREIDLLRAEYGDLEEHRRTLELAERDELKFKSQVENGTSLEGSRAGGSV